MTGPGAAGDLHVTSDGSGSPAVLVCAGMADAGFSWEPVTALLAGRHRVVRFDRPGLGGSPALRDYPTLDQEAERIDGLVRGLGLDRPVIVAHSAAALHAEAYARRLPTGLSGLVLVDPDVVRRSTARQPVLAAGARRVVRAGAVAAGLAEMIGLVGLMGPLTWRLMMRGQTNRPPRHWPLAEGKRVFGTGRASAAALAELISYEELAADLTALRERTAPPAVPVVVLTALGDLRSAVARARCRTDHDELARSFPDGRHEVLRDSRHLVQLDDPAAIAAAVASCLPG